MDLQGNMKKNYRGNKKKVLTKKKNKNLSFKTW